MPLEQGDGDVEADALARRREERHQIEAGGEPTDDLTVMVLTYRGAG